LNINPITGWGQTEKAETSTTTTKGGKRERTSGLAHISVSDFKTLIFLLLFLHLLHFFPICNISKNKKRNKK